MPTVTMEYEPRWYQQPPLQRLIEGATRNVWVWPRRHGKDLTAWNWTIGSALQTRGGYLYFLPTREQAKRVIWNNYTKEGKRFTEFVPREIMKGKPNETDLRIELKNGSMIQLIGADNFDGNVGTSFKGAVFSEYAVMDPMAWQFMEPIAVESGAWIIFVYTPRGDNHGLDMYNHALAEIASGNKKWAVFKYDAAELGVMSAEELEESRRSSMRLTGSDKHFLQEYYTRFDVTNTGTVFGEQIEHVYKDGRLTEVPYNPALPVFTSWDVGVADPTAVWFWQRSTQSLRLIDYYEESRTGLEFHAKEVLSRPYNYAGHYWPHDMNVFEFAGGEERIVTAERLGLRNSVIVPKLDKQEQFHYGQITIPLCYFDEVHTSRAVSKLGKYGYKFNEREKTYAKQPKDNENSHAADAFMIGAIAHSMGYFDDDGTGLSHSPSVIGSFGTNDDSGYSNIWSPNVERSHERIDYRRF